MENYRDYKLCYVDNIDDWNTFKLYFTDKFEDQWGDDWNDRPANCNAGEPYTDGRDIKSIIIEFGGYGTITFGGKTYSVEDMNTNKAIWLIFENIFFEGGDTLKEVLDKINIFNKEAKELNKISVYVNYIGDDN